MRARFTNLYRDHDVIPITAANAPFWIRETMLDHRSQAKPRRRPLDFHTFLRMLSPNIDAPVFAVGAPRSGTTFLGECLSALPEISYYYEPVITKAAVRLVYTGEWSEKKAARIYRSVYRWLMRYQLEPDLTFCEKTPGNCFIMPFLHRTFPGARFIHIVRDGRDSAISLAAKPWYQNAMRNTDERDPDGYRFGPGRRFWVEPERIEEYEATSDRHRCIWLWRRYVEEALAGSAELPADRLYMVRYEDLVSRPAAYGENILDFLGVAEPDSRKRFLDNISASAKTDSVGRWRSLLADDETESLQNEAGDLLRKLDYEIG
jgi:hypothetical protein